MFNKEILTVMLQQAQGSKHRGRGEVVSSVHPQYIFAGNTSKTHLNLLESNMIFNLLWKHNNNKLMNYGCVSETESLRSVCSSPEQVSCLQAAH